MSFTVNRRDGLYSLDKVARNLCRLITAFTPTIQRLYPSNAALLAALAAANAACAVLQQEVQEQRSPGV